MNRTVKKNIEEKLLHEIDSLFQKYYYQTLDEVITELRLRCIVARSTKEPGNILIDLYRSGILNSSSNTQMKMMRNTIGKLEKNTYGLCSGCGQSIPEEWLLKNPFVEYCSYCMVRLRATVEPVEERVGA